jgi:uncharacterized repeat protein (TIGR01451 family)
MSATIRSTAARGLAIAAVTALSTVALQIAGLGVAAAAAGDISTVAVAAPLHNPISVAVDPAGNVYVSDLGNNVVRKVDTSGTITTVAGGGSPPDGIGDGGPATSAALSSPFGIAVDAAGDLFIADQGHNAIREVNSAGTISTVAGNFNSGFSGDGGLATSSALANPSAVLPIPGGGFYLTDTANARVRKVDASGVITTVAGDGLSGSAGDGGAATRAQINQPFGLAMDEAGDLFISDIGANTVRQVDPLGGISTVAGSPSGASGYSGDGGPATAALLNAPAGLAYRAGSLFITDNSNNVVRQVDPAGTITTVAGNGSSGYSGDGGPATAASLAFPGGVALDGSGNLLIADTGNSVLRRVDHPALPADLLALRLAATPTPGPGQPLTYAISVVNPGTSGAATGVTVTDSLPAGVAFGSVTSSQGSCTGGAAVSCALGLLAPGATATVTIQTTAPAGSTTVSNTAQVSADQVDPLPGDNRASVTTTVDPADVSVSLSASQATAQVPTPFTYNAIVSDAGPYAATTVKLTDALPAGLTIGSPTTSQGSCSVAGSNVTCQLGTLAPGATASVSIPVTPTAAGLGMHTANASVSADQIDPDPTNNSSSADVDVLPRGCGMVVTQTTTLSFDIGPCPGNGVVIGADNITVNLNGHKITGTGTGSGFSTDPGDTVGVVLRQRVGVTVSGGSVSGFDAGVVIVAGSKNTVTGVNIHDNIGNDNPARENLGRDDFVVGDGIVVGDSALNKITGNTVVHNGPFDGIGVLGPDSNGNLVQNNDVERTVTSSNHFDGEGILISSQFLAFDRQVTITQNDVLSNTVVASAASGISVRSDVGATIAKNQVSGSGLTANPGNGIDISALPGYGPTATHDTVRANQVSGSGADGVRVSSVGNTVRDNSAGSDNALHAGWFDLQDTNTDARGNPSCGTNTWFGNRYGTAGFAPVCAGTGGHPLH